MKTLREKIEVMEAFERGEKIETSFINYNSWINTNKPEWNWNTNDYRVKPGEKYEPYTSPDEIKLGAEIKGKDSKKWFGLVTQKSLESLVIGFCRYSFEKAYNYFEYIDGTPFGKRV